MVWLGVAIVVLLLIGLIVFKEFFWLIAILAIAIILGSLYYLWTRICKFSAIKKLRDEKSWKYKLVMAIYIVLVMAAAIFQLTKFVVCLLHLVIFWLIGEGLYWIFKKISKKQWERYYVGGIVLVCTLAYLSVGWYNAHHVIETNYEVHVGKDLGGKKLRILHITDMHVGATFDGDGFAELMEEAAKSKPDIVVTTGDFVDEDTTREDMIKSCKALGDIPSKYGVYFVYGNHDKGNYIHSREFFLDELIQELEKNDITILEDETLLIDDWFYLMGRKDRSEQYYEGRMEMSELVEGLDSSKFLLVLDHQPTDYDNQKKAGADLVLSGHTHGGHVFPAGIIGDLLKANCMTYGIRTEGDTSFEVSSGISGWEIPFKTFALSEYVVIDVEE